MLGNRMVKVVRIMASALGKRHFSNQKCKSKIQLKYPFHYFLSSGCGVVVAQWSEHWQLKPGALGLIPSGCPDVFSSSKLSDVDGVMSSVVL